MAFDFEECFEIVPIHVYKFSFRRRSCGRLEETVVWSPWKTEADYFTLTTSSEKNFSLIASRIEKNTWNIVKITFSCGNYHIFTFFSCCLSESRNKDHIRGPKTIENGRLFSSYKQNIYVWKLKLHDYREEHKSELSSGSISALYVLIQVRYSR